MDSLVSRPISCGSRLSYPPKEIGVFIGSLNPTGILQIAATYFNYRKHIEEFKMQPPTESEVFLKAISSLAGPFDPCAESPEAPV